MEEKQSIINKKNGNEGKDMRKKNIMARNKIKANERANTDAH